MTVFEIFDDTFFITISSAFFGFLAIVVRACLKSNCKTISCCCFSCHRYEKESSDDLSSPTFKKTDTIANHL